MSSGLTFLYLINLLKIRPKYRHKESQLKESRKYTIYHRTPSGDPDINLENHEALVWHRKKLHENCKGQF
jgi:hypothetical protein